MQYPQQRNDPTAGQIFRVVLIVLGSLFGIGCIMASCITMIVFVVFGGSIAAFLAWITAISMSGY